MKYIVFLLLVLNFSSLHSEVFTVSNTDNSGTGSLRQAIVDANNEAGDDSIVFNIPSGECDGMNTGICRILIDSAFPIITEGVTIDGTTQPQWGSVPNNICATDESPSYMRVEIVASGVAYSIFDTNNSTPVIVKGLSIGGNSNNSTSLTGFQLDGTTVGNRLYCNHIGVNAKGNAIQELRDGIHISFSVISQDQQAIIGTNSDGNDDIAERNIIHGDNRGLYLNVGGPYIIAGNYFSLTSEGVVLPGDKSRECFYMRQSLSGILVGSNLDGQYDDLERNLFGSCETGIFMEPRESSDNIVIAGNWFGLQADTNSGLTDIGISLEATSSAVTVLNTTIKNNWFVTNTADLIVDSVSILSNDSTGNCLNGTSVGLDHRGDALDLAITNNYWGADDGPSGDGTGSGSQVLNTGIGSISYTPFLTSIPHSCATDLIFFNGFE